MKTISSEQKELIDALVAAGLAGNLSAAVLEKDVHLTAAAESEEKTRQEYQDVLMLLIYGPIKPTFVEAFSVFKPAALAFSGYALTGNSGPP